MSERTVVDLIEEWKTGALILIGSFIGALFALAGVVQLAGSGFSTPVALAVAVGGGLLTFVGISYLLYGR